MKPKATTIDAYLAAVTGPQQATLEKLRATLHAADKVLPVALVRKLVKARLAEFSPAVPARRRR